MTGYLLRLLVQTFVDPKGIKRRKKETQEPLSDLDKVLSPTLNEDEARRRHNRLTTLLWYRRYRYALHARTDGTSP